MRRELIPRPQTNFLKIKCGKCGNEQIVFERSSTSVTCKVCDEVLTKPTGGKAKINGEILQLLG